MNDLVNKAVEDYNDYIATNASTALTVRDFLVIGLTKSAVDMRVLSWLLISVVDDSLQDILNNHTTEHKI